MKAAYALKQSERRDGFDLSQIERLVRTSLGLQIKLLNPTLSPLEITPLQLTPDKNYTAKSESKLYDSKGQPITENLLTTILFQPGDGTGNQNDYKLKGVPPSWTPRRKTGYKELFIPIGTFANGSWHHGRTHLAEVILGEEGGVEILKYLNHRTLREAFGEVPKYEDTDGLVKELHRPLPLPFALTYDSTAEKPNGGEHAIVWDEDTVTGGILDKFTLPYVQAGAFISFPTKESAPHFLEGIKV